MFVERVHKLPSVSSDEVRSSQHGEVQVRYTDMKQYEYLSKELGLMSDTKVGLGTCPFNCCALINDYYF